MNTKTVIRQLNLTKEGFEKIQQSVKKAESKMNVLVINCGSSSLKYQVIDSETEQVLAKGLCERIGIDGRLVYTPAGGEKETSDLDMPTHKQAIQYVIDALTNEKTGVIKSLDEIGAVGHRLVHGGEKLSMQISIHHTGRAIFTVLED